MTDARWDAYLSSTAPGPYRVAATIIAQSPTLSREASTWLSGDDDEVDWVDWFVDVANRGRGWSSTEWRLFKLARQVLWAWEHPLDAEEIDVGTGWYSTEHPGFDLHEVIGGLNDTRRPVLAALIEWLTDGSLTVTETDP